MTEEEGDGREGMRLREDQRKRRDLGGGWCFMEEEKDDPRQEREGDGDQDAIGLGRREKKRERPLVKEDIGRGRIVFGEKRAFEDRSSRLLGLVLCLMMMMIR